MEDRRKETQTNEQQIIYGKNAVTEALRSDAEIDTVYILRSAGGMGKIISLAKEKGAVIKEVGEEKLISLMASGARDSGGTVDENKDITQSLNKKENNGGSKNAVKHGGVAAVMAAASYSTVEDILAESERKGLPPFIIAADGIQDPHNLGAIIRTAGRRAPTALSLQKEEALH